MEQGLCCDRDANFLQSQASIDNLKQMEIFASLYTSPSMAIVQESDDLKHPAVLILADLCL